MAQTLAEADAIGEARGRNGVVVFVGYMRRYVTALGRLKDLIAGKEIRYVRVRDIIGRVGAALYFSFTRILGLNRRKVLQGYREMEI